MTHFQQLILAAITTSLMFSCEDKKEKESEKTSNPFTKNLINPLYLDQIFNTPNNSGSYWNGKYVKQLDINKISIYLKGGNNPDNILEKYIYTFDKNGNNDNYSYFYFANSKDIVNQTNYEYKGTDLAKINIYKYFGVGNLPPVLVSKNEKYTVFYKSKANGKNDSLFFYPNVENPKLIIDKIGNFVNSIEVFMKEGTSIKKMKNEISKIDTNLAHFDFADKTITYINNKKLPIESYHLGENWSQLERSQVWEYNKFDQPTLIKEWMHGTLIKNINIIYNENSMPKKIIYNRKNYHIIYSKI